MLLRKRNTNHHFFLYLLLCSVIFSIWTLRDLRSSPVTCGIIYRQGSVSCLISMHVLSNLNFFWPKSELGVCSFLREKSTHLTVFLKKNQNQMKQNHAYDFSVTYIFLHQEKSLLFTLETQNVTRHQNSPFSHLILMVR